jgi:hypothetical protein
LGLAFNESVSRQWIAKLIHQAGRKAREILEGLHLREHVVQAAADEIFAGQKPILTVVDPVSLALLDAVRSDHRRGQDWEAVLSRYPRLRRIASDCGTGLLRAIHQRGLEHQPDIFHGLHELYASVRRLEALAHQAIERESVAIKGLQRAQRRDEDRRPAAQQLRHATRKAEQAVRRFDLIDWLAREIHAALEISDNASEAYLRQASAAIQTAIELLKELGVPRLRRIQTYFEPEKVLSFLRWQLDHPDQPVMRASSSVEAVNSFLRTDQTVKKHLDQEYLDLLRWFYDMRPFSTGQRQGHSPLELMGITTPFRSWLDPLLD